MTTTLRATYARLIDQLLLRGHELSAPEEVAPGLLYGYCLSCGRTVHVDAQGTTGDAARWDCESPLWEGEV